MASETCADCANKDLVIAVLGGEIARRERANRHLADQVRDKAAQVRRLKAANRGR